MEVLLRPARVLILVKMVDPALGRNASAVLDTPEKPAKMVVVYLFI